MRPPWLPQDDDQSSLFFMGAFFVAVLIGLLFLANVLVASVAGAQESNAAAKSDKCITVPAKLEELKQAASQANIRVRGRILSGADAQRYMASFNSLPPPSDTQVSQVGLMLIEGAPFGLVWFDPHGCVPKVLQIPLKAYFKLLDESGNRLREADA